MFVDRTHPAFINLAPDEERLYRLPPMSNGPFVRIAAFDAYVTTGPKGKLTFHEGPTGDLELELRHSNHFKQRGTNLIRTESLWHDDLWRLWVRRPRRSPDPAAPSDPLRYKIEATYTSQLPILERPRIPASFFHDGFEVNWNRQQYVFVNASGTNLLVDFTSDFAQLHGLETMRISIDPVEVRNISTTGIRFDIGAGRNSVFFSAHVAFKAGGKLVLKCQSDHELPAFSLTVRLYLVVGNEGRLGYVPELGKSDALDFVIQASVGEVLNPFDGSNFMDLAKARIEAELNKLLASETGSKFGQFLAPWLVGGRDELSSIGYAPGPGDTLRPDGIVEPATGELIVRYIGPRAKPSTDPVFVDPTRPTPAPPVDDGSVRLFDLPDEDPDPVPGGGGGGVGPLDPGGPFGGRPDIGALAKIDHIVVLMQENRSFDQVLGYLRRDGINPDVDGLLPPGETGADKQVNVFNGRTFPPKKADKDNPRRAPEKEATAWPTIIGTSPNRVNGPCHDTACVLSQMSDNMGRFVADFAKRIGVEDPTDPVAVANLRLVMDYFGADDLPVFAALAREFGICDRWYTSHAGPTWPNRFVLLTGDLNRNRFGEVEEDNPDVKTMIPIQIPTIFDHLTERGATWRVFEHGYSFPRLFRNFTYDTTNIVPFGDPEQGFEATARRGALPQVTLIEPDYIDLPPGNDDHPPADMKDGQDFVQRIVQALIDSPTWERTLLIITYDEHGGFYDHRQPPIDAPPLLNDRRSMGPRVPTFVVSPLIERGVEHGTVFHSRFDHTSIGATILRRFSANRRPPRISPRLDAALDLRGVLTLAEPRPRSDFASLFASLGPPELRPRRSVDLRSNPERSKGIGEPQGKDDFHWVLSAVRLTTGEPPKVSSLRSRPSLTGKWLEPVLHMMMD